MHKISTHKAAVALAAGLLCLATSGLAAAQDRWGGAWGYATSPATRAVKDQLPAGVYRFRIRLSQSGDGLALTFTNPEGALPLRIASAMVAPAAGADGFALDVAKATPIRFGGGASTTLTGGASLVSDALPFAAQSGQDVIISVAVSQPSTTVAGNAGFPLAFAEGASDPALPGESGLAALKLRPFVTMVAARNPSADCTVVTFGDSITEGARGLRPDWRGWPGTLAQRLTKASPKQHCGVVNMGISGNRLLREGRGTAGIARFDRDVASVPNATHLIVLEGINDIWRSGEAGEPQVTLEDLTAGYQALIAAGHARGMKVLGATLTPGFGSKYITPEREALRQAVNRWIRTSHAFDAVIDFEAAVRDTSTPPSIRPLYDSGDKLHPGDAGYEAMGQAVPLGLVRPR